MPSDGTCRSMVEYEICPEMPSLIKKIVNFVTTMYGNCANSSNQQRLQKSNGKDKSFYQKLTTSINIVHGTTK